MKLYRAIIKTISPLVKFFLRVNIIDERKNKDYDGTFVICANHLSNWDPILVLVATQLEISFMAKESLFKIPVLKQILNGLGAAFPVNRKGSDMASIKKSIEIIKNGGHFSLFPQGRRLHVEPSPEQAKKGIGFICAKSGASVLPIGIYTNKYRIMPFRKITVRIGDIIPYENINFGEDGSDYLLASQGIFEKICHLARRSDT